MKKLTRATPPRGYAGFRGSIGAGFWRKAAAGDGEWRSQHSGRIGISPGQGGFSQVIGGCPRQDSNLRSRLRRPLLSPLSYGGSRTAARLPAIDGVAGGARTPLAARQDQDHLA